MELFIHQLGNAGNRQRFHEKLLSGFGRWQSRCQITNPSVQPESLILRFNQSHEESFMNIQALFGLSVFMSFVAFGLVTQLYIWPRLRIWSETMRSFHWWCPTRFGSLD